VALVVVAIAVAAAGAVVGVTLATRTPTPRSEAQPLKGAPPLELDLGVRTDEEAVALRRADALLRKGERKDAAAIFARHRSLEAQTGLAFAEWPERSPSRELALADENPTSAFAQLHLGLALLWNGRPAEAQIAFQKAERVEPDSLSALHAEDFLHQEYFPGHPVFEPSFPPPRGLARLSPPRQLARLEAAARSGGFRAHLLYGAALQRLGKPLSARREFAAAVRLAPRDPDAQTAAAVGLFDKANPSRAFSRLGPLAKRFPHAATVRYHLGLMLLWIGQAREGRQQLRLAVSAEPSSPLAREAKRLLARLVPR
jgi:tetratricopeptide (TPR) repeat protein